MSAAENRAVALLRDQVNPVIQYLEGIMADLAAHRPMPTWVSVQRATTAAVKPRARRRAFPKASS
jgi:hypothetical protein